jgi:hypothetical protein
MAGLVEALSSKFVAEQSCFFVDRAALDVAGTQLALQKALFCSLCPTLGWVLDSQVGQGSAQEWGMCLLQVRRAGLMEALSSKLAAGRILIVDELVLGVAGAEFALRKALHANMAAIKDFDNPRPVVGNKKPGVFRQRVYAAIGGDRRVFGIPSSGLLYPDDEIVDNIMKRVRANGVDAAELLYRTSALRAIECFVPQIFVHRTFIPTMSRTSALQGFCGTLASLQLRLADEQGRFDVAEILYRTNVPPIIKLDIVEF